MEYLSKRFIMKKYLEMDDEEIQMSERHKWDEVKETLLDGLPDSKRDVLDSLFENQKKNFLSEGDELEELLCQMVDTEFQKILIPIIRRVVPTTLAQDLVSVQPMSGPVEIFGLRYSYDQRSELEQLLDEAQTGKDYVVGYDYIKELENGTLGEDYVAYTLEAQHDLKSQHGLDIENEIVGLLAQEIADEIDQEIIMSLKGKTKYDAGYFYCPYVPTDLHFGMHKEIDAFEAGRDVLGVINFDTI